MKYGLPISHDLDDLLLPYTIDLSIYADIGDLDVIERIQRVGLPFYQKGETVAAFKAAASQ